MHKISISPITRANAVGSVTVLVEEGKVIEAYSEGTLFRGFEMIMEGRDPWDAPYFTQRICGICSSAHAMAASLAIEAIAEVEPPPNGILTRNIIFGLDTLQNHIRHFYMLGLWDWAAPPPEHPFTNAYFADFRFTPGITKQLHEHYWQAAEYGRLAHEALTLVGGKAPHNHGIIPGGAALVPRGEVMAELRLKLKKLEDFVSNVYLPDVLLLQETYPDYLDIGLRENNFLSFGVFPKAGGGHYYPSGVVLQGKKEDLNLLEIEESHLFSKYKGEGGSPYESKTLPDVSREEAYSWIKAPRYHQHCCEGGPFVRQWMAGRDIFGRSSVMARIVSRAREALEVASLLNSWFEQIVPGDSAHVSFKLPQSGRGIGHVDAMRGPLSHWVTFKGGRISSYQIITPTAWNFSPRDGQGHPGPVEQALVGTPVGDTAEPVEIGRVIRSFDPCYACATHVIDLKKGNRKLINL